MGVPYGNSHLEKPQFKTSDVPTVFRAMLVHENYACSHNIVIRDYSATEAAEKWERINKKGE